MSSYSRLSPRVDIKSVGSAPGTLIGAEKFVKTSLSVMVYNKETLIEKEINDLSEIKALMAEDKTIWINVFGLRDLAIIEGLGSMFGLHSLALEDVLNIHHRPKVEEYEDQLFIITRMARIKKQMLDIEQVSIFLGKNFVISFQEREGDCFDAVRMRLRKGGKRIRSMQADYLAYTLIDSIVDNYFPVMEFYSEGLNAIEDVILDRPEKALMENIHRIKNDLRVLRHGIWPLREAINTLFRDMPLIKEETKIFLRDCSDHVIQIIDIIDSGRERAVGLTDLYLSSLSNKTNDTMKVLTIIATIFMPLGFIAGLYGMNFDPNASPLNMPELRWYFGYPFALALMLAMALSLLFYFWRKGWIGK